jgi:hypothetical protein
MQMSLHGRYYDRIFEVHKSWEIGAGAISGSCTLLANVTMPQCHTYLSQQQTYWQQSEIAGGIVTTSEGIGGSIFGTEQSQSVNLSVVTFS